MLRYQQEPRDAFGQHYSGQAIAYVSKHSSIKQLVEVQIGNTVAANTVHLKYLDFYVSFA